MAESISIDSARLVLPHTLLLIFGKASLRFFEVVDSVSCLDSKKLDSKFCFCESLESMELDSVFESEVLNLRFCVCFRFQICQIGFCV